MTRPEKPAFSPSFAALLSLCVLAGGCAEDPAVRAKRFFESGNRYYDEKKYREAAIEYRNAIQIEKASSAVAALRTTVELAAREATYQYHLGLAYVQNNEPQHAREALERALRLDKTFAQATEARRVLEEPRAR
jgi:tetratricopeptide (TPR) repeat protein